MDVSMDFAGCSSLCGRRRLFCISELIQLVTVSSQVIALSVELGEFLFLLRALTATVTHQRRWLERQDGYYSVLSTLVRGLQ